MSSADLRPLLHAATGLFAFLLGVLPRALDLTGAVLGVLAGWVVIPASPLEARLRRPGEPFLCGLRTYPLAVLGLVLLLPDATAAAAWCVFAFGDAVASIAGRHVKSPALFGHRKATWSGSGAFVLVGTAVGWGAGAFVAATGGSAAPAFAPVAAAAFAGALVDLVRIPPDDNVPIAATAGLVLAVATGLIG